MKKILVLNLFPTVFPPTSGGTLRYYHVYHELSRYYDTTLLSQTQRQRGEMITYSPNFREYRVNRDPLHKEIKQKLFNGKSIYEHELIVNMMLSQHPTSYKKQFDLLYMTSDLIIHESPYLLGYDRYLGLDNKPRIYNSHNHEYVLANQIWKDGTSRIYLQTVYYLEKKLIECADLVFATSEIERASFSVMYDAAPNKVKLAPNGIHPKDIIINKKTSHANPRALFIGANYPPNIEAVECIIHHLADKCPTIQFMIAGSCCKPFKNIKKSNVHLLGKVTHKQKIKLFTDADLAINPMFKGAGVNLKTLEFLSSGIPLFSTSFGIRGLNLIDKKHYVNAEKKDFAKKLNKYSQDRKRLKAISSAGQKYINAHYTWPKIAKSMKTEIEHILK
ncbi:glycosyltransferase family 4 protein [Paenibacillus spongiae]|uniref:Glycosyltransferase family 4 protein n=1 Tax=Paenibacillus spongiae TaxID=2909671 RepID=A0ABY5S6B7_9BACL|nr:glycosyltransferase family 4 protein [Paenibacillus spongiae]UVI28375.1 glycosyltransferase family 4 protein [Paenibacillus spongiae]